MLKLEKKVKNVDLDNFMLLVLIMVARLYK